MVELGGDGRDDKSDYSGLEEELSLRQAKVSNAVAIDSALEFSSAAVSRKRNANIDSGCSITMTPYKADLQSA